MSLGCAAAHDTSRPRCFPRGRDSSAGLLERCAEALRHVASSQPGAISRLEKDNTTVIRRYVASDFDAR